MLILCDTKFEYCLLQTENTSQQSPEESVEVSTCNFHDNFLNYLDIKFESKSVQGQNLKINYVTE